MPATSDYTSTEREQAFLRSIEKGKYDRRIVSGLSRFIRRKVPEDMRLLYSDRELSALTNLKNGLRDIEARMPVKITRHYFEMARNSEPLRTLIKASPKETMDLAGAPDPGRQMDYSPVEGLIHKYELGLIYVASTCSAHCRFCYREELIARKTVDRPDGSAAPKGLANIPELVAYIREHNRLVAGNGGTHPETGRVALREILMSGGDPMVLNNRKIGAWLAALAEAGIDSIRIGTKELAFHPDRIDHAFLAMLDSFHGAYPRVQLRMVLHFNHPDEFLLRDAGGEPCESGAGVPLWRDNTRRAVEALRSRHWVSLSNQTPIIRGINDDADTLRLLQRELKRAGVENHYFFCGRDIIGHKAFNVPIEAAWRILNDSQKGLSGIDAQARLVLSHFKGKIEVVAVIDETPKAIPDAGGGLVVFKLLRSPADAANRSKISLARRHGKAVWIDAYENRMIYDGAGIFSRNETSAESGGRLLDSVINA